ncbi:thiamine pyrophosphate-dependent enzyme [Mangrovimonas sp. AS39]|uniref:alpha-ketoacid dehydrogenase subunit alpha/beta n=1 Tax=Mangrovimonas futianensis TaxID=2895523 RepID=UPI001E3A1C1C|nr:alpha-ketoacid dehydrogenase subunit alpha/beta [Mangrovimonas futianensis]MCF1192373.1 thiamine pyrophosphate-dependent enzyme [Mangrovimonas futianensis]MCF1195878.1 thiamine pyrophosphate-dependent enzyme [Mangrovimonas futianensis]
MQTNPDIKTKLSFDDFKQEVLNDYKVAVTSRECSLLGRREVLTGKAKFGIFGGGKEVPQLAMAKAFKNGDFRSGYYRDQTFMMAIGKLSIENFFSGLYANIDFNQEPMSGGRQMGGHFMTTTIDENGDWLDLTKTKNTSSDISPTAGQMPRLLGLAQASKIYRHVEGIDSSKFSNNGNEVAWGTIGNASTSEGLFFETINAAGVLQVPMIISVWDDEYGISVHAKHQTTKENISEILKGFQKDENSNGYEILKVKGWDYVSLIEVYEEASQIAREKHVPVLIHVQELTQPQGHSTSGSHERYKSKERLEWEVQYDCNAQMREWMIATGIATEEELSELEKSIKKAVRDGKKAAWTSFVHPIKEEKSQIIDILDKLASSSPNKVFITKLKNELDAISEPIRKDVISTARKALKYVISENTPEKQNLINWIETYFDNIQPKYSSHLYSESKKATRLVEEVKPQYKETSEEVDARIIIRDNFNALFSKHPEVLIFGEDSGNIGDVNQGLEGMQEKYGELRVADAGIREATILGQGIGMAMRGLRPIAEIQYLDYLMYALQTMSDDLSTVQYRTKGHQKAPVIVRTRGHRLEGIWHSGSQLGGILNLVRGILILVPRNMTKAAGFYNTLLESDDPALVIECLNGYRLKEKLPTNMGDFKTPVGVIETLKEGKDITLVSYGSTLRIVEEVAKELMEVGIDAEVIDVQSLIPFDLNQDIVKSVAKTNRLMVIDEDVPGGASAYILNEILNTQNAYKHLDSKPSTLTAKEHRPAYGSDGDYFSKPSHEDIFEAIYAVMHESDPNTYPKLR